MINKIKDFFNKGNERSQKAKRNILGMLFLKGGNILIGLLLVPMTLNYVSSDVYGIWIALSSMISWISFFDIGISNGLKNNLATALAKGDLLLGRKYVSTTYAILSLIFIPLLFVLLVISNFVNWNQVLNIENVPLNELFISVYIIIAYFCLNFILSTINTVILAEQRPADAAFRNFLQQFVALVIIYILTLTTKGNLIILCTAYCFAPLIVVLFFNIVLFKGRYKHISPSVKYIDFSLSKDLMKLGAQFFIIQIAAVVQYQMINFLILRYYGASEVTSYNIGFKYFSILTMVWGILTTPLWVAVTDAIAKNDYEWIRNTQKKYLKIFLIFLMGGIVMLLMSDIVYGVWLNDKIEIPFNLSFWILIYNVTMMLGGIFVFVINGSGKLKIQTYASLISPFVFLGCCVFFIKNAYPIYTILIAAIISNFNGLILAPLQCRHILRNKK